MRCPFCDADKESLKVIDSRTCEGGKAIRRRRQCLKCEKRFTTYERVEETVRLTVIKKDGRRMPFERGKLLTGLQRACFKRPVAEAVLEGIVDEVEEEMNARYDREVPTEAVGGAVADRLKRVDQVAYVRFASVYRRFKTVEELMDEARAVVDAMRFEDPTQGKLFVAGGDEKREGRTSASAPAGLRVGDTQPKVQRRAKQRHAPPADEGADGSAVGAREGEGVAS